MEKQTYSVSLFSLIVIIVLCVALGIAVTFAVFVLKQHTSVNQDSMVPSAQEDGDDLSAVSEDDASDETVVASVLYEAPYKSEKLYNPSRTAYVYVASDSHKVVQGKAVNHLEESGFPSLSFNGDTPFVIRKTTADATIVRGVVDASGRTVEQSINELFFESSGALGYVYIDSWIDDTRLLEVSRGGDGPVGIESFVAIDTRTESRNILLGESYVFDDTEDVIKKHLFFDVGTVVFHQVCDNTVERSLCGDINIFTSGTYPIGHAYSPEDLSSMKHLGSFGLGNQVGVMHIEIMNEYNKTHVGSSVEVSVAGSAKTYIFDLQQQKLLP